MALLFPSRACFMRLSRFSEDFSLFASCFDVFIIGRRILPPVESPASTALSCLVVVLCTAFFLAEEEKEALEMALADTYEQGK